MDAGKRDQVTGRRTTGHEWNGIEELDTPVPRVVLLSLAATFLFSVACWILLPAWPLVSDYTRGLLGIDQRDSVAAAVQSAAEERAAWEAAILAGSYEEIAADPALMQTVQTAGRTLFIDNCAVCHGTDATGGPGYPNLRAKSWLWGGEPDQIVQTIRDGINSTSSSTRVSQMLAFGRDGLLDRGQVLDVVAYVQSLSGPADQPARVEAGRGIFAENCASCHGADGTGLPEMGAPDLTDAHWIYGGDLRSIFASVHGGRQGHMPHWGGRLTEVNQKILGIYVWSLPPVAP